MATALHWPELGPFYSAQARMPGSNLCLPLNPPTKKGGGVKGGTVSQTVISTRWRLVLALKLCPVIACEGKSWKGFWCDFGLNQQLNATDGIGYWCSGIAWSTAMLQFINILSCMLRLYKSLLVDAIWRPKCSLVLIPNSSHCYKIVKITEKCEEANSVLIFFFFFSSKVLCNLNS